MALNFLVDSKKLVDTYELSMDCLIVVVHRSIKRKVMAHGSDKPQNILDSLAIQSLHMHQC